MSDTKLVQLSIDRGVARITLDSPHNRNALSLPLVSQLLLALEQAAGDADLRGLVLTATGPTFCAGADLKEDPARAFARAEKMIDLFEQLSQFRVPTIVHLNGNVRAGGLGLLGAADIVIAPSDATFAFTEVRLGVVPAIIAVPLLPRLDARLAQRYLLTGELFDAATAARLGLITEHVPTEAVPGAVEAIVSALRRSAPSALATTKRFVRERAFQPLSREALTQATAVSVAAFTSDDGREGLASFREKRAPRWVLDS